jgi:isopentenyl diphosphate isomerase/L-lactate dehydrogenase-like FMN-dependent dehydrogenase
VVRKNKIGNIKTKAMAVTFQQLEAGQTLRYTYEENGKEVWGKVLETNSSQINVQWEDETTTTEYHIMDTLTDFRQIDIIQDSSSAGEASPTRNITKKDIEGLIRLTMRDVIVKAIHRNLDYTIETEIPNIYNEWKQNLK